MKKKLSLNRETLKNLTTSILKIAVGASGDRVCDSERKTVCNQCDWSYDQTCGV